MIGSSRARQALAAAPSEGERLGARRTAALLSQSMHLADNSGRRQHPASGGAATHRVARLGQRRHLLRLEGGHADALDAVAKLAAAAGGRGKAGGG